MRRVAQIMGIPISVDIPEAKSNSIFTEVFRLFTDIDKRFNPFKEDSELCKYQKGEIEEKNLSSEMKNVMLACKQWEKLTDGYFSAWYAGIFEPSGYVKGWAIKRAGDLLKKNGYKTFCIGAGGDILAASGGQKKWQIGIQDPRNQDKILNKLSIYNGAIATSGTYERGNHIINPKTKRPATELLSISVVGPNIITADVLTTAGFAMGEAGIEFVNKQKGYQALAVARKVVGDNFFSRQS